MGAGFRILASSYALRRYERVAGLIAHSLHHTPEDFESVAQALMVDALVR